MQKPPSDGQNCSTLAVLTGCRLGNLADTARAGRTTHDVSNVVLLAMRSDAPTNTQSPIERTTTPVLLVDPAVRKASTADESPLQLYPH